MTSPAFTSPDPPRLSQWVWLVLRALCATVAARGGRDHSMIPLVNLAWSRISKTAQRFERLVARVKAGRAAPVRRPGGTRVAAPRADAPDAGRSLRLPRDFGWLVRVMLETSAYIGQVEAVLADPEMVALLAAEPSAGRILRPLCRMLGIEPALASGPPRRSPRIRKAVVARPPEAAPWSGTPAAGRLPAALAPCRPARWVVWRRSD